MKLESDTTENFFWVLQILRQCLHVERGASAAVITYSVIARATRMLAFLLPLKVILLAGSEGVPRYFQAIVAPDQKNVGVVALSTAAVICYAVTLVLEAYSRRLSERGSDALLAASGVMALVSNQRMQAQGFFARFMQATAAFLFALAGLIVLALLNPWLVAWVLCLIATFFLITTFALRKATPLTRTRFSDLITERLGTYLSILSSITFLSSFLVILHPFLVGTNGNILVAIICIVLLRQVLSALTAGLKDLISLAGQRQLIDTLIFSKRQFEVVESKIQRTLRDLFNKRERERVISAELSDIIRPDQRIDIRWVDSPILGLAEFDISLEGASDSADVHMRQIVFPPRFRRLSENEDLLFRYVSREAVCSPAVIKRYVHGEHECVIYDLGDGERPQIGHVSALQDRLLARLWALEPPAELVEIYRRSHKILPERLTDDFVARMDIAADTEAEGRILESFQEALPEIRQIMTKLPLRLTRQGFLSGHVLQRSDGEVRVLGWGSWSLEPIGASLPVGRTRLQELRELLALIGDASNISGSPIRSKHLRLMARGTLLERTILRGKMKIALKIAADMQNDLKSIRENGRGTGKRMRRKVQRRPKEPPTGRKP